MPDAFVFVILKHPLVDAVLQELLSGSVIANASPAFIRRTIDETATDEISPNVLIGNLPLACSSPPLQLRQCVNRLPSHAVSVKSDGSLL